jgi:hypothetical protein
MSPLHPKTIERVARLACDLDGPTERRVYDCWDTDDQGTEEVELAELPRKAGRHALRR